ncbi:hypothetical protein BJD55_gp137 [Gordonia phage Yvonnetastic]|uniref:Uncharacterized protein n=1 Tax=Gordonia phage Yvonnetastic TaxID=1821566 RepID=A0A142K946_9CAUD|nr:hypothetical protein BJD55_gp137 [Gordonia phage Yvonnetastic]AMS02629.1 hypothetical protein SEA_YVONNETASTIC_85 [Gordonia phage Yvonnetastic]WKW86061.1 hypothetical protein SEA_JONJAMES_87 [Gordonia Phage JonJames]
MTDLPPSLGTSSDDYCCVCWGCKWEDHEHTCSLTKEQRWANEQYWQDSIEDLTNGTGEPCLTCGLTGGWHTGECADRRENL